SQRDQIGGKCPPHRLHTHSMFVVHQKPIYKKTFQLCLAFYKTDHSSGLGSINTNSLLGLFCFLRQDLTRDVSQQSLPRKTPQLEVPSRTINDHNSREIYQLG